MSKFEIKGDVGDVFIRITKDREVQLIFGEDEDSIYREVDWEGHEVYKAATNFALMLDSYLRNSKALDDLITTSATGSIPAELIGRDLLPIMLAGAGLEEFQQEEEKDVEQMIEDLTDKPKYTDNVIQFKNKEKDNEDK
tara:strand:+ start:321 stop:737 length:417 start_codon:yes stop_codon:yes gene_type:complete